MGILSAMEILVELQDIRRFHRADQLAAYLGLTPSQYSSGEHIRMGSIRHTGNERVRSTLVECSWWVTAKDMGMREKYDQLKRRRGAKRAIVAIARILSLKIRRMLLDEVNCQFRQPQKSRLLARKVIRDQSRPEGKGENTSRAFSPFLTSLCGDDKIKERRRRVPTKPQTQTRMTECKFLKSESDFAYRVRHPTKDNESISCGLQDHE
jgi:hypothetical protein